MMTPEQQQPQDTITPEDIGAEWGIKLGALILEKISLQKQNQRLTAINNGYAARIRELELRLEAGEGYVEAFGDNGKSDVVNAGAFGDSGK